MRLLDFTNFRLTPDLATRQIAPTRALRRALEKLGITADLSAIRLAEGVRAAFSTALIVAANEWLNWPLLMQAALAALFTCLCDAGGPIQRRVPALLTFAMLGAALWASMGLIRGFGLPVALPVACLTLFITSFARVWGQAGLQMGTLLSVITILGLDEPLDRTQAGLIAGYFLAGSFWATLVTMVLWPIYPFLPARRMVAEAYRALARLVDDLRRMLDIANPGEWAEHARQHRSMVRTRIEQARGMVLDTVRARGAVRGRASQSLIRVEAAEQLFAALLALDEVLEREGRHTHPDLVMRHVRAVLNALAHGILTDSTRANRQIAATIDMIEAETAALPESLRPIMEAIADRLRIALTLAIPANYLPDSGIGERSPLLRRFITPVLANLNWQSLALRHAARAAMAAAPALAFTLSHYRPYEHWLTIILVTTLQPYFGVTVTRVLERIGGSVLGGVIAAFLGLVCTTPLALAAAVFFFATLTFTLRQVSFGLFQVMLTPLIILLLELNQPDTSEWVIAGIRILYTAIGALLALVACLALWPSWEPNRLVQEVRKAIEAHRDWADLVLKVLLGEAEDEQIDPARRAAGLASNNLEVSISRASLEPKITGREQLEAVMVIDAALRRMAGRLAALQINPAIKDGVSVEAVRTWRDWLERAMDAVLAGQGPPRRPATGPEAFLRLARQMELISGALTRFGRLA
ncbi:MAG: FUSC family protein [Acetobacteraceae bacterium]|nr:FUSC family protein [Acetobacteraceae bacterium]